MVHMLSSYRQLYVGAWTGAAATAKRPHAAPSRPAADLALNANLFAILASLNTPQGRTGIPAEEQLLSNGGRLLLEARPTRLQHGTTLDLLLRLAGGKGGFGALLRGQGRDGKITDNFDACR